MNCYTYKKLGDGNTRLMLSSTVSQDQRRWSAELAAGFPARFGERRDPRGRVEASSLAEFLAVLHRTRVPAIEGLVEGIGLAEPGERASDARSERERVGAGEVSTHIRFMSVTLLVSQLFRGWLKALAWPNLEASERRAERA